MSYSFREPEEPPVCECKYDHTLDRMDREDCTFHASLVDDTNGVTQPTERRRPIKETRTGTKRTRTA